MPDNVEVVINEGRRFTGRLIGFITDEECAALINVEDAARKVSTEKTMDKDSMPIVSSRKRFVLVTSNYNGDDGVYKATKVIFISPKIKYASYCSSDKKNFTCEGNNVYQINFT